MENDEINGEITQDELLMAISKLKLNKSVGIDGIPNEVLKMGGIFEILLKFMNMCLKQNLIPSLWTQSIIKPIPKGSNKDPHVPLNYRGISLLSCVSKLLSSTVNTRICRYFDRLDILVDEQNGFRKKRSCEEHLFTLTNIIRNRLHNDRSVFIAFVDFEKAFDWVDRTLLLYRLINYNIDGKMYKLIKRMYTNTTSCVNVNNLFTAWFDVNSGVRQGDNLSPTLFGSYINDLAQLIKALGKGVKVGPDRISILLYADDIVLLAESETDLQTMLDAMYEWTRKWRLKVNVAKTKIIQFRPKRRQMTNICFKFGDSDIDKVHYYKYLGIYLDEYLDFKECVRVLVESGGRALGGMISKFRSLKDCGFKTYTKLFDTSVVSILNYGSEVWGFGKYDKCDTIMNRAMRYYLGVNKYAPNAGVQGDMAWLSLKYRRYIAMLRFWNRLIKLDTTRITKRVFNWYYENPENNWCSDIRRISYLLNMPEVYRSRTAFDLQATENKVHELMQREWSTNLQLKPKLRFYLNFKTELYVEPYVKYNVRRVERSVYAQIRLGMLPLHIETGRYLNTPLDQRICRMCDMNVIEDECHFIFVCPTYVNERQELFIQCFGDVYNFDDLPVEVLLVYLTNDYWKLFMKYLNNIWMIRKEKMYV